ncbi:peptidoglycan-associated lipoprotein Pal [Kangiella koreensis]|uniref:Peptidoglycan-associated lipoprotein n=1 Tax=Kangiella koreensis (strain DSM 16069 / JCM 12317 / KCTC 12182 / SW-125) TaxID=523791 RepID=C7R5T5_KANKD|nr:peptidoglycan-associated lipoprotein Pal [Kangiella koreensis]ACV27259.1 peptidoglycan-associated lipoprotein [Kangiella koreensis DSM 16069]
MKRSVQLLLALTAALTLAACSTTKPEEEQVDTTAQEDAAAQAEAEALARQRAAEEAERQRIAALLDNNVIYFDFDDDSIRSEYVEVLEAHAMYIQSSGKSVVLEGHADERGTPEYNLALGERRAKSVAQLMRTYGVSDSNIEVISFGEESPANPAHNESAWQENRRVEIKYQ